MSAIQRIVSGGQTGVDRAALDVAFSLGIPCGGWCPKGRLAEDGVIPLSYPLRETPTPIYEERTAWNVRDSDGTLVLTWGTPEGGTAYTVEAARDQGKPCLVVDLSRGGNPEEAIAWVNAHTIRTLNVAGPRAGKCARIYEKAMQFLEKAFSPNSR